MSARNTKLTAGARQMNRASAPTRSGEFARIDKINDIFSTPTRGLVRVGIGDDAAVLSPGSRDWVWTVDSSVQNVHFRFGWLTEADIGWKSFQSAVSDLAAMGATPVGALSALELPKSFSDRALKRLLDGQQQASTRLKCPVIGGNLAAASSLVITTTVLGCSKQPLLRSGAEVGDELWLVGDIGLARAGLLFLSSDDPRPRRSRAAQTCVEAWRRPVALIGRGLGLVGRARAAIDISDGLVGDATHLADASRVAIEIDLDAVSRTLSQSLVRAAEQLGQTALEIALQGGEDYALLAAGPHDKRPRWAHAIGKIVSGVGVWGSTRRGGRQRLRSGFDHFAD